MDETVGFAPVFEDLDSQGMTYVVVCNKCYQPIDWGTECRSGAHTKPDGSNVGLPMKSIDMPKRKLLPL